MSDVENTHLDDMPNIDKTCLTPIDTDALLPNNNHQTKPRILLLYGSLRDRSFSRLATEEAARILEYFGAETRTFNPSGLPLPDDTDADHPKVQELRDLANWCEGMVWCGAAQNGTVR
jgi:arsenic resistance protein ArsH